MEAVMDVRLPGTAGTLDVMWWLRDNEWPDEVAIIFFHDEYQCYKFSCSQVDTPPNHVLSDIESAHVFEGMIRYGNPMTGWYIKIIDQWYFLYH